MGGLISLREAAMISGYHQDYLSFLIRKNQLHGKKIGRAWCVREDELKELLIKKNKIENITEKMVEKSNKFAGFFNPKMKQVSLVSLFILVSLLVFLKIKYDKNVKSTQEIKNRFVINTVYSDDANEISSQTSTKN